VDSILNSKIIEIARANGLVISQRQIEQLDRYAHVLLEWNTKVNLISRKDENNIFTRHLLHSLTLAMSNVVEPIPQHARVLDLGTGGGLPGIPLKIVRPDLNMVLSDSIQKKVAAVSSMISELTLTEIRSVCSRAEDLPRNGVTEKFDVVVTRAVAPLVDLVTWSESQLLPGAHILALKGGDLQNEIAACQKLAGVKRVIERPLDLVDSREFVADDKKLVIVEMK
jgi:16S rRNA (guanine527-N7)-methyltransferase